jgi:hypothetical protein
VFRALGDKSVSGYRVHVIENVEVPTRIGMLESHLKLSNPGAKEESSSVLNMFLQANSIVEKFTALDQVSGLSTSQETESNNYRALS